VLFALSIHTNSQTTRGFRESASSASQVPTGKYYALFIANQDYLDRNIPQLTEPYNDAVRIKNVLTEKYNFSVAQTTILKNPKRADFYAEFARLSQLVTENDYLIIFYAGHGSFDEKRQQGYWWPSDAQRDNQSMWISNGDIRDQLKGFNAKHTLLIADACFSGGLFRTRSALPNASYAIEELVKKPSRRAITSGTLNEVPDKSVFVEFLVKRLTENKEQYLTAQSLFASFQDAVINNSPNRQVPQYGVIQEMGDEGGDFIFYHPAEIRLPTTVLLTTSVSDAEVFIDGLFVGKATPELKLSDTQSGKKLIEVKKNGYAVYSHRVDIISSTDNHFEIELSPLNYAKLNISSNVPAKIYVNDTSRGFVKTALKTLELTFGQYEVKLLADGYKPFTKTLNISEYGDVNLFAEMKQFTATLKLFGSINAEVYLDDVYFANAPVDEIEVPFGEHSISVIKSGYEDFKQNIDVNSDKSYTVPYRMIKKTHNSALSRSLLFPGLGQMYNDRNIAGYAWSGAFVVSLGNLVNKQLKYNDRVDAFNAAADAYLNEKNLAMIPQKKGELINAENIRDEVEAKRNLWIGITAGIYLLNIADLYLFEPNFEKESLSLDLKGNKNNITASAIITF
jgi:hypothetical protein